MRLPFVSRERFEEKRHEVEKLESEREKLLNRIALLSGQIPLYPTSVAEAAQKIQEQAPVGAAYLKGEDGPPPLPVKMRHTVSSISQWGNREAARRAATPGVSSVTAELAAAEARGRANAG